MLCKKNLVIILDTNILVDIVRDHKLDTLSQILKTWLTYIIQGMKCNPKGKRITFVASTQTLQDYKTGLMRSGHNSLGNMISGFFAKSISINYPVDKERNIYFSIKKISPATMIPPAKKTKRVIRDKYDKKFSELIDTMLRLKKGNDYFIIVATRDAATRQDLTRTLIGERCISVEGSIRDLEKTVEC